MCQGFSHFSGFLHQFVLAKLATSSIRVNNPDCCFQDFIFWYVQVFILCYTEVFIFCSAVHKFSSYHMILYDLEGNSHVMLFSN